jgi:hypothetical protein
LHDAPDIDAVKFEERIKKLVENLTDPAILVEPLLFIRRVSLSCVVRQS